VKRSINFENEIAKYADLIEDGKYDIEYFKKNLPGMFGIWGDERTTIMYPDGKGGTEIIELSPGNSGEYAAMMIIELEKMMEQRKNKWHRPK